MTDVTLDHLTKVFPKGSDPAVEALSLDVPSGTLTALLGPSGCGKTTVMRMIAGLLAPTSGDVRFDGQSVLRQKPEQRGAVMVYQNNLLFPHMSVAENIGFGLKMRKTPKAEIARRVSDMLGLVRLPDLGRRLPAELSGGQQQRVALARALIVQPKVLLLDEPLSSLDAHLRIEMRDLIQSIQRRLNITTIIVTHDQEEAVFLADRVALILNGQLRQYAPPEMFFKRPADEATARFFGAQNFVAGRAEGRQFISPLGPLNLTQDAPRGPGVLTIRPESIQLVDAATPGNRLLGELVRKTYLGTQTRLQLRVNGLPLTALAHPDTAAPLSEGQPVAITLPEAALWFLPN